MTHLIRIANCGEIVLRVAQAAADRGRQRTAVVAADEAADEAANQAAAAHRSVATRTVALGRSGPAGYLDINRLLALARDAGCDDVHPGCCYLSERADFVQACSDAGLLFIGPTVAQLATLGDKARALALAPTSPAFAPWTARRAHTAPRLWPINACSASAPAPRHAATSAPAIATCSPAEARWQFKGLRLTRDEAEPHWRRCADASLFSGAQHKRPCAILEMCTASLRWSTVSASVDHLLPDNEARRQGRCRHRKNRVCLLPD